MSNALPGNLEASAPFDNNWIMSGILRSKWRISHPHYLIGLAESFITEMHCDLYNENTVEGVCAKIKSLRASFNIRIGCRRCYQFNTFSINFVRQFKSLKSEQKHTYAGRVSTTPETVSAPSYESVPRASIKRKTGIIQRLGRFSWGSDLIRSDISTFVAFKPCFWKREEISQSLRVVPNFKIRFSRGGVRAFAHGAYSDEK